MAMGKKTMFALGTGAGLVAGLGLAALVVSNYSSLVLTLFPPPPPDIPEAQAVEVAPTSREARDRMLAGLDFGNRQDFEFGARGFIASRDDPVIMRDDGNGVAFDLSSYGFLASEAPDTVNPSLWRQAQLITRPGLFKVADNIWQVRGFDVSVVSFILTSEGFIVVDPLTTMEVARAALELVRKHVGDHPVVAVVYSHSHADHFGGVSGIITAEDAASGRVKVIAPEGFLEHAIAENVIAGNAMARRGRFQFGATLGRGPEGEVTSGLGPGISRGVISLIAPNVIIDHTGQEMVIGGVRLVFQVTPGTEAPAEMNFFLPEMRALFMAENANANMHNLLPARGALVRDSKAWADYLTESIRLYAGQADVMFAAHGIPRFGTDAIIDFLKKHRDAYKFLHDQSVRLMNAGLTGPEIAEVLQLPEVLAREWYNRGYYGTMSHNSKAVYQRYMGWYDANPANLNPLPPETAARNYVAVMGGADAVMAEAQRAIGAGEFRWAAMLLNHVVFAGGDTERARNMLADVYTQLGYASEAGTWRNIYLTGAQELRFGPGENVLQTASADMIRATPTSMMLDLAAVRLNPEKARGVVLKINLVLSDTGETHFLSVENSVFIHETGVSDPSAQATITMPREAMMASLFVGAPLATLDIQTTGDGEAWATLVSLIDGVDPNFNIVTP